MYAIKNLVFYFNMCKKDDLYRNIIERILRNLDKLGDATIYEWANTCFASPTSISRLSRKLGYDNFSSFKTDLDRAYKSYCMSRDLGGKNSAEELESRMTKYFMQFRAAADRFMSELDLEKAENIVDMLHQFDKIRLYATIFDAPMVELQENLLLDGKNAIMLNAISEQQQDVQQLTKDTLVVIHIMALNGGVLLSGIHQVIMEARKRGAALIIISDSPQPGLMGYADYFYSFDGDSYAMYQQQYTMFGRGLSMIYREKYLGAGNRASEDAAPKA